MEAFSLLKYWRGGGVNGVFSADDAGAKASSPVNTTAVSSQSDSDDDGDGDDGPFFDLEFTALPEVEEEEEKVEGKERCKISSKKEEEEGDGSESENEGELKFTLSPSSSSVDGTDPNVSLSPSDDLFFKGSLVPIEPSSLLLTASEANSKFSSSLLKSATKFRVLMLKLKKPKSNATTKTGKSEGEGEGDGDGDGNGSVSGTPKLQQIKVLEDEKEESKNRKQSKFLTVKFKVEEVPIKSLFTRDSSSKSNNNTSSRIQKRNPEEACLTNAAISSSDEKKFSKDMMQKYLKKVKPLYIRVSKRYGEKLKFSGQLSLTGNAATKPGPSPPPSASAKAEPAIDAPPAAEKNQKQGNIPTGLRIVRKHLGKSRSASSAVVAASPVASNRRDDSLLQQQDAIQGAILHCKRSFNSSRDSDSSILSRSASDASHEKSTHSTTDSSALEEATEVRN